MSVGQYTSIRRRSYIYPMKNAFFLILITVLSVVARAQPSPVNLDLYLLIGQSNMAGRGVIEDQDKEAHPRVWVLNKEKEWVPAKDPLHFDKPPLVGVGPGLTFGKTMAGDNRRVSIGLIPAAAGGSPITVWLEDQWFEATKSYPYREAIARAKAAMKNGTLKGIIWHQGESDSNDSLSVAQYKEKLTQLVSKIRTELNAPQVPFVAGELASFFVQRRPLARHINADVAGLKGRIQYFDIVTAEGLTHKGDTIHFDSQSARELGRRYATAMKQLQKTKR
jgi:hypothetical protein